MTGSSQPRPREDLGGEVAIVTGSAHGIGRSTAIALAEAGARVAVFDIDQEASAEVEQEITVRGCEAPLLVVCDVSDETQVNAAVQQVIETLGTPSLLVNNAAFLAETRPLLETEPASWDRSFAVTLRGAYLVTRAVLPGMVSRRSGSIVNVASVGAVIVFESYAAYCTAKAGLVQMTRSVAVDYGTFGIRANAVLPGAINTREIHKEAPTGEDVGERLRNLSAMSVLGRVGEPDEVADAITFLLSERASFITGAALLVDGGWSIR